MSDIPPTSSVSAAPPVAAAGGSTTSVVEAAINNIPGKIQQLARQIEVSGTIAQAPDSSGFILNTVLGQLSIALPQLSQTQQDKLLQQLNAIFQNQKPLTVALQPGNPPTQALLLLPQAPGLGQNQATALSTAPAVQPAPQLLQPNATLTAIVLPNDIQWPANSGAPPSSAYANYAQPLAAIDEQLTRAPGANVANVTAMGEKIVNMAITELKDQALPNLVPPQNTAAAQSIAQTANQFAGNPATLAPVFAGPSPEAISFLQPGSEISLQVNAIYPPATTTTAPAVPIPGPNQILATVTGTAPGGQIILKAGDATLFVRQPADAPVDTQLLVTIAPLRVSTPDLTPIPAPSELAALQQTITTLMQADPTALHAMLGNRIPQPGDGLAGAMLFFMSAIKQGDVRGWLGSGAVDLLTRAGKLELIARLAEELQQSGQTVRDNVVGEWRSYPVPLHDNNHLNVLHFYVHRDSQHHRSPQQDINAAPQAVSKVRFLIDLRMSRLGALQIDGFLRPKQLDIVMRSENRLPPSLDRDLRNGYINTMSAIGYTGMLTFQTGRQHWLIVQPPVAGKAMVT